jgi:hypothetical protein
MSVVQKVAKHGRERAKLIKRLVKAERALARRAAAREAKP